MILSALLIALCTLSGALAGLSAGDDGDCALYVSGRGRTSAYDYTINLLKGNFGYDGQQTCITYDAVNQAYIEARNRILVSQPKGDWKPEDFASVGELVLDISINLARRYGLTYEEVEKGLPLIDTSRTLIREVCPPVFSHVECRAGKYRRLDGLCNNLQHPTWGSTNAPFQRLISPLFADGINSPRISHTGRDLPLSRVVSRTMHPDDGFHDHAGTVMVIAWGQFMDHDYTLTGTPLDPHNRNDPEECCKRPPHLKHPYCNEIRIPDDDYFYRLFGVKCIDFVRAFPSPRPGCRLGSRIPFNTLTGAIDGNTVYGVTEKFARKLRTGFGGLLRMNPVFKEYGLKDLLPLKLDIPDEGCTRPNKNMYCFEAGEIRVNEQLILTVMHTLMAREHNRVANALAEVNPHWDDETLYQEARRINIAEIQHITYNEFLPILLGKDVMEKFGLVLEKEGFWEGYDPEVNPDVLAAFAAAAYRFGHSLLPTAVERWSKAHKFIASKRLSDLIRRPYDLYRAGVLDEYVMGLMNQVAQAMDDSITQEVTNHLFKKVGARFGMDLVSFNMQRGREFGLPGYMEFRKFCGLPGAETFQDLFGTMTNHTVRKYESIFEHPIDVDLWSGGVSERPLPGSMLGPTFACIIATQFSYSRRGDRFWFELPNQPSSFTPEQLVEIRKSRLARIICDNTDIIDTVQLYPMVLPDHELNPRVPCRSGVIPMMDFSKWAEPAPFHGHAKQYVTHALITSYNGTVSEVIDSEYNDYNNTSENEELIKNINMLILSHLNDTEVETAIDIADEDINLNATVLNLETTTAKDFDLNTVAQSKNSSAKTALRSERFNATNLNDIPVNNVVLKYVYKKDDKLNDTSKTQGHEKNRLSRRKRSQPDSQEQLDIAQSAPQIVNYETSHGRNIAEPLLVRSANIIKNSDLADFSIETLHQGARNKKPIQDIKPEKYLDKPRYAGVNENEDTEETEKFNRDNESGEKYDNEASKEAKKQYRENESTEKYNNNNYKEDINNNRENYSNEENDDSISREHKTTIKDHDSNEQYVSNNSKGDRDRYHDNKYNNNKYKNTESAENIKYNRERSPNKEYDNNESLEDRKPQRDTKSEDNYDNNDSSSEKHGDSAESSGSQEYIQSRPDSKNRPRESNRYINLIDTRPDDDSNESHESRKSRPDNNNEPRERSRYINRSDTKPDDDSNESHENRQSRPDKNNTPRESSRYINRSDTEPDDDSNENHENRQSRPDNNNKPREINRYINRSDSKLDDDSNESHENRQSRPGNNNEPRESSRYINRSDSKPDDDSNESHENKDKDRESSLYPSASSSKENEENNERINTPAYIKNPDINRIKNKSPYYNNNPESSHEVQLPVKYKSSLHHSEPEKILPFSNENSNESSEEVAKPKHYRFDIHKDNNSSPLIQDVDLDRFSYERIQLNNKGDVEPTREVHDVSNVKVDGEIFNNTKQKPEIKLENYNKFLHPSSQETTSSTSNQEAIDNSAELIKINDGEVKPVVELNIDNDSAELTEENINSALKAGEQDESLETLLGVKEPENKEQNGSTDESKKTQNDGDLKQQFERIPLNYKHRENTENNDGADVKSTVSEENDPKNKALNIQDDGTLDTFSPPERYDENLNIKFDDLVINLPEIKLPDDILAYSRDDTPYASEKIKEDDPKKNFYHYSNEQSDEQDGQEKKRKNKSNLRRNEDDRGHYGYYGDYQDKEDYQKKQNDDEEEDENENEGEDLYEKFVRERFGKRGSFEKRSEQLQDTRDVPRNPELYKTIQSILKNTEDVEKQAVASGDPKAGYMWTLEYGENAK